MASSVMGDQTAPASDASGLLFFERAQFPRQGQNDEKSEARNKRDCRPKSERAVDVSDRLPQRRAVGPAELQLRQRVGHKRRVQPEYDGNQPYGLAKRARGVRRSGGLFELFSE